MCVAVVVVESAAVVSSARPSPLNTKTRWEFQAKNARRCRSVPVFRALLLVPQPIRPLRRRALASCARRDFRLHRRRHRRNDRFLQLLSTCCTRCFIVLSAACFIINYYAIRQQCIIIIIFIIILTRIGMARAYDAPDTGLDPST